MRDVKVSTCDFWTPAFAGATWGGSEPVTLVVQDLTKIDSSCQGILDNCRFVMATIEITAALTEIESEKGRLKGKT